ncbi:MAG: hypothetical protein PHV74_07725 [Dehalococcoidia bacterium]|nr:hypothetical protein [Dehalococcoidia bacterium]
MGEYALRRSDNQEVKIGTCESMYYLRYEDRNKVSKLPNSLDPATTMDLFWRLPFPDEDNVRIGEYQPHDRGLRLWKTGEDGWTEDFADPETAESPGMFQLYHRESGFILSVACYHGNKLPEETQEYRPGWNGKSHNFELAFVKNTSEGVLPVARCRHCGLMWRYSWGCVISYIQDKELLKRLEVHM